MKVKVNAVVAAGTTAADAEKVMKKNKTSISDKIYEDDHEIYEEDHVDDFVDEGDFLTSPTMLTERPSGQKRMLVSQGVLMENAEVMGADLLLVRGQFQGLAEVVTLDVEQG